MEGPSDNIADDLAMRAVSQCEQVEDLLKFKKINVSDDNFLVSNYAALNNAVNDSYNGSLNDYAWGSQIRGSSDLAKKIRNGIKFGQYRSTFD